MRMRAARIRETGELVFYDEDEYDPGFFVNVDQDGFILIPANYQEPAKSARASSKDRPPVMVFPTTEDSFPNIPYSEDHQNRPSLGYKGASWEPPSRPFPTSRILSVLALVIAIAALALKVIQ